MEMKLFYVTIGMIVEVCAFGAGVIIGGLDKRKHNTDRSCNNCDTVNDRDDRGNNRHDYTQEVKDLADELGVKIGG